MNKLPFGQLLLAIAAGAMTHLAFAPYHLAFMPLLTLPLWLWLLDGKSARQGGWLGFAFGFGMFMSGIWWVHVSMVMFGDLPLWLALGLMILLSAYLALYPALTGYLLNRLFPLAGWPRHLIGLPLLWLLSEWLRGWVLTGFPWLNLGTSQLDTPLGNWLPIGSEALASFWLVMCAGALALARYQRRWAVMALTVIAVSALLPKSWVKDTGQSLKVTLVQGNIAQSLKWDPDHLAPTLQKYLSLTTPHLDSDLIIWPEAAIPDVEPAEQDFLQQLDEEVARHHSTLVTGIVDYRYATQAFYNTAIVLDGHYHYADANRYQKHHLLPIGEYVPFAKLLRPLAPFFNLPMSDFNRGPARQPNLKLGNLKAAMAICYEVAFSGLVRADMRPDTQLLLTISNDAWFGNSIGPHQHMQIAQARARELGRPMLRATNDGVTAIVDAQGHIQQRLPRFVAASLTGKVKLVSGQTPYARFGLLWCWLLLPLGWLGWRQRYH